MSSFVKSMFRPDEETIAAHRLYGAAVERARAAVFYADLGVPDTPTGRFSLIALHGFLVIDRLGGAADGAGLGQKVFAVMVADIDRNLREMGVGDLSVGKKVKALVGHFIGMSVAVRKALTAESGQLDDVIIRNIYGGDDPGPNIVATMSGDLRACVAALAAQPATELRRGRVAFPATPKKGGS